MNEFLASDETIHIIPGTPSEVSPTLPREYRTKDLLVKEGSTDGAKYEDWVREVPELFYDVFDADNTLVGDISVRYDYESNLMAIGNVIVFDEFQRKGYATQLYSLVPQMVLPCGRSADEAGFDFVSDVMTLEDERSSIDDQIGHSDEAEKLWQSLEKKNLAVNMGGRAYWWVRDEKQIGTQSNT